MTTRGRSGRLRSVDSLTPVPAEAPRHGAGATSGASPDPAQLVPRPRLIALLQEATRAPLTLVVAPAGSGKTALLRSWASQAEVAHAWVSLEESDREPTQLWRSMLTALEVIAPGCTASCASLLGSASQLLDAVRALADDLEARVSHGPSIVVIDDFELVDDDDATRSLALFVQHLPVWLHLVIASRREPRLPVHRLRARGQLGEVHFAELRFSADEAIAMLHRLAPDLDDDTLHAAATRTGGWAANIQLAALAARSARAQGDPYLPDAGDERHYLEDYVWREVFASERPDLIDVLSATSVVTPIDPALAAVLSGRPDADSLLAEAEARGVFLTRIEPSGDYKLQEQVREVLLSVLAKRAPDRYKRLQALAAEWSAGHGAVIEAIEHWLRADRPREALRLVAAHAPVLYDGGNESVIIRTVAAIPENVIFDDLDAMMDFAWSHLLVDRRRFVALVDNLSHAVRDNLEIDPVRVARIEILSAVATTLEGDWRNGASLARSALETLGDDWWHDPLGRFAWNMIARDVALSERWVDTSHEARHILQALSLTPERRIAFEGTRALAEALAGRPTDALRIATEARHAPDISSMSILRTEVATAEALAYRELGDVSVALPMLHEIASGRIEAAPHCQLLARLHLTSAHVDAGDLPAASATFQTAVDLVHLEMPRPGARSLLARTGVTLALAERKPDVARDWAAQVIDGFWTSATNARILIAEGELKSALESLHSAEPRCLRHQVVAGLLLFRAGLASPHADRHLLDAVRLAAGHDLVQTVASEGHVVVEAVERLAWRAPAEWLDRLRRAGQPDGTAPSMPADLPTEPLTDRELEVLRMLPSRLTLREIADELYISINTLKFHLKVIYRKLGCTSRAEASERARSLANLRRPAPRAPITRRP